METSLNETWRIDWHGLKVSRTIKGARYGGKGWLCGYRRLTIFAVKVRYSFWRALRYQHRIRYLSASAWQSLVFDFGPWRIMLIWDREGSNV